MDDIISTHKLCRVCKTYCLLSSFGSDSKSIDGISNRCRECERDRSSKYRNNIISNDEKYKKHLENKRVCMDKIRSSPLFIDTQNYEQKKKYISNNKHKIRVRKQVFNAIQSGVIEKDPCLVCGDEKSEAHHEDYSKPYNIMWLCRKHHREIHRTYSELRKTLGLIETTEHI